MTHERDVERLLDSWCSDGPREAPDRVLDAVAHRIHRRRQRPAWLLDRRPPTMSGPIRLLAIAAVLVGALAIGGVLIAGGARPAPTPAPSPGTATASPSAAVLRGSPDAAPTPRTFQSNAVLAAGEYVANLTTGKIAFALPDGWGSPGRTGRMYSLRLLDGPPDDIVNVFTDMRRAAKDDACTEAPEPGVGVSAAAILEDLRSDDQVEVSEAVAVTLDGMEGSRIDVRLAADATRRCPFTGDVPTVPLVVDTIDAEGPFFGVVPGERQRLYLLDTAAGGNVVIAVNAVDPSSFDALAAAADEVIATMSFTPAP